MNLETKRLRLRPMQQADIPALVQIWTDPEVTRYMGHPREQTFLEEAFTADLQQDSPDVYDLWPVVEKTSGQVAGHCGLLEKEVEGQPEIELVYVFARPAWGKGLATEMARALKTYALEQMRLPRLVALIDPDNAGSERVAQKAGMRFEKHVTRPGGKTMRLYAIEAEG